MEIDPNSCGGELRRILDRSLECAVRLEELLREEQTALERQEIEKLPPITASKETCVQCLQSLEAERRSLCAALGFGAGPAEMEKLLKWCDSGSAVSTLWSRLLVLAEQCESLNRTNGAVGRIRHDQVMSALVLLSGNGAATPQYRADGQESSRFQRRALARI